MSNLRLEPHLKLQLNAKLKGLGLNSDSDHTVVPKFCGQAKESVWRLYEVKVETAKTASDTGLSRSDEGLERWLRD